MLLLILYPDTDLGSPSPSPTSSLAVTRAPFCLILRTLARHMMHLRGSLFWATAIWMVLTKHFLQTTWWPQGRVCMQALLVPHTTHCNYHS